MKRPSLKHQNSAVLASREQRLRVQAGGKATPLAIRPGFEGKRPRACQWIAGEPGPDDSCKCGAPVAPGKPWCEPHQARAWRPAGKVEP